MIEEFISGIKSLQKKGQPANERFISLYVFSRRLIHLNTEKYMKFVKLSVKSNYQKDSNGSSIVR